MTEVGKVTYYGEVFFKRPLNFGKRGKTSQTPNMTLINEDTVVTLTSCIRKIKTHVKFV
jgi:hypothetical protein